MVKHLAKIESKKEDRKREDRKEDRKAQIWISAVLYVLITVIAIIILLEAGTPVINSLRDRTALSKTTDTMLILDKYIADVSEGGAGSQRVVPLDITKGNLYIKENMLRWKLETASKLVEPRSKINMGNLIILGISSDQTVSARESDDSCFYMLENSRIRVNITQFGNISKNIENCSQIINTSNLINYIELKDRNSTVSGRFSFTVAGDASSAIGSGSTTLLEEGDYLSSAVVRAEINSTNYNYTLEIALESGADFLTARIINVRKK